MGCVMDKNKYIDEIEQHLLDITLTMTHEFTACYEQELSSNQQLLMYLIGKKKILRVKELAYYMNVSASAVSQMLAKLEQLEYVVRTIDEDNRRQTVLHLLERGETMLEELEQKRHIIIGKYLTKLSEKDLISMRDAFSNLNTIMQSSDDKEGEQS